MNLKTDNEYNEADVATWAKWGPAARHAYNRTYRATLANAEVFARSAAYMAAAAVSEATA